MRGKLKVSALACLVIGVAGCGQKQGGGAQGAVGPTNASAASPSGAQSPAPAATPAG